MRNGPHIRWSSDSHWGTFRVDCVIYDADPEVGVRFWMLNLGRVCLYWTWRHPCSTSGGCLARMRTPEAKAAARALFTSDTLGRTTGK